MIDTTTASDSNDDEPIDILWIIESRTAGAWSTSKPEVAAKHAAKPDSIVTPYQSKRHLIKG